MAAAVDWAQNLARDLVEFAAGRIEWSEVDPGALIHGEPGTGKTLFAKAVAATCELPLIATSYAQWQRTKDGHMGDVLSAMHAAFQLARHHAPSILFIDEIEAVSSRDAGGHNQRWYTGIITALNEEFSDTAQHKGVVIIAAANYPDRIDPALLRAGRLDTKILIPMPSAEDLEGIIRFHLDDDLVNVDLGNLAVGTVGSTGADVERLVRIARRRARMFKRPLLLEDLLAVLGEKLAKRDPGCLERIAIHEAGHATAAIALNVSGNVAVSLFALGTSGASTFLEPWAQAVTRDVVERKIAVALAGRAAEEELLGDYTGGAGGPSTSDLALANNLAYWAVARWGLSERDHLRWLDCPLQQIMSDHPDLAEEARSMLHAAYALACSVIGERKQQVRAIADALLERKALAHADIAALLAGPEIAAKAPPVKPRRSKQG
jgi:ATP-dependent Zn protease